MLDKFVCVRLVKANNLDLTRFQFDYDLTFAVIFLNADKTVYGRYGTRSSVDHATRDISIRGLAESMNAVLELHAMYPGNRSQLAGKQPVVGAYRRPGDLPSLKNKYKDQLDYQGEVTKSCLHCHQIRDAKRQVYRDAGQPIPDRLLLPYPLPRVIGLSFDPQTCGVVKEVQPASIAAASGFEVADELLELNGQAIVSLADIQWVLHRAEDSQTLSATVRRSGRPISLNVALTPGWRSATDISWRVSSWALRRMVTGGLLFEAASANQRRDAGVSADQLALVIKHVGQYGAHAAAKRAGFRKGDMVVSFDGQDDNLSTSQLLAYAAQHTKPGQKVPVVVIRNGKRETLTLPMQK